MKKTACQSAGVATNQAPPITDNRLKSVYHKRKPNAVVRGLYAIFYWLGDFGPMFGQLFRFIGRSILVTVNMVILVGIIIISFSHSLELLRYAGLRNGLEWVGVIVWELAFIFSSMVLSADFKRGNRRSGWAPWTGFLMGLVFVIVSNYTGMADNPTGRILGVATPLLLLVFKGVLAHQVRRREVREADREVETDREKWEEKYTPSPAWVEAAATREDGVEDNSPALAPIVATRENREERREESRETAPTPAAMVEPEAPPTIPDRGEMETEREEEAEPAPATEAGETTREDGREEIREREEAIPSQVGEEQEEKETSTVGVGDLGGVRELVGDKKRFTREEIEEMAARIYASRGILSKRKIKEEFGITEHYAKEVRKILGKLAKDEGKGYEVVAGF